MNKQIINEGLDYLDMEHQITPTLSIDEYAAKIGKDSDIVTMAFIVKSEDAGSDLSDWLERGYPYILDAEVSDGEISPGKHLVFAEMKRRSNAPERIVEILEDMETLTGLSITDWTVRIDNEEYDADESILKQKMMLSPREYKADEEEDEELNEMRTVAGLPTLAKHTKQDKEIVDFKTIAGL
jgi:hypothetical protein